jgi:hypothetical protein
VRQRDAARYRLAVQVVVDAPGDGEMEQVAACELVERESLALSGPCVPELDGHWLRICAGAVVCGFYRRRISAHERGV